MEQPLVIEVTREEYRQLAQLKMPCDVKELERILKDERASAIFSASFHDQEVECRVKNEPAHD